MESCMHKANFCARTVWVFKYIYYFDGIIYTQCQLSGLVPKKLFEFCKQTLPRWNKICTQPNSWAFSLVTALVLNGDNLFRNVFWSQTRKRINIINSGINKRKTKLELSTGVGYQLYSSRSLHTSCQKYMYLISLAIWPACTTVLPFSS